MAVEKKNIFLSETVEPLRYVSVGKRGEKNFPPREDKGAHANFLRRKFEQAYAESKELTQKQVAAIRYKEGVYLEFSGAPNYDLKTKSLENLTEGIRLLNIRVDEDNTQHATVYIPQGKESYFIKRIASYIDKFEETGKARNQDLIDSIEDVKLAILKSFWIGKKKDIPKETSVWCEIWLHVESDKYEEVEELFIQTCRKLEVDIDKRSIVFPERLVKLAFANEKALTELISRFEFIAEIRRASEVTGFFDELESQEQRDWTKDLISRTDYNMEDVSVCILDTGITQAHPLLTNALSDNSINAVDEKWGLYDHNGHGTEMAGIGLYNDLKAWLLSKDRINIRHQLESVKILPPKGDNRPELYGAVTQNAVYLAEIKQPQMNRAICMAVTSSLHNTTDGSPTSWSAEVDNITSGALERGKKRLFFISAGNVIPGELKVGYPDANLDHPIENPGQAWNAITVGAYSNDIQIDDDLYNGYKAVADVGDLSPFSSTSMMWDSKWPIKPEILCDGGNVATNGTEYTECTDLSHLTTFFKPTAHAFSTINATSSATAKAAWMAAQIMTEYPNAWPETVRALIIHSAQWTEKMKKMFCLEDKKTTGRRALLRACGYGIPDLEKAIQCMRNSVNLVVQDELQPFININGASKMNEMHIHKIPWPKEVLRELGNVQAVMRVTLSYFVEPGPGEVGWKDKYRYPSCGLRFDVNNSDESKEDFAKRINVAMRGEDKSDKGDGHSGSKHWFLGENIDVGSIHSDFRQQNAVDLCDMNYIAVYPVIGWWRERSYLGRCNKKIRYSLVVSITTPGIEVDLYTPIVTQIETEIKNKTAIQIQIPNF